jgi:hypothetical protein
MKGRNYSSSKQFQFKAHNTVSAGEILSSGGATAYSKQVGSNSAKLFNLPGESITEVQLNKALEDLANK